MVHLFTLYCIALHYFCAVIGNSTTGSSISKGASVQGSTYIYHPTPTLLKTEENELEKLGTNVAKTRFKRQESSGAGKFSEAARTPQLKVLRLFLTMFWNLFDSSYTGGAHPFHPHVPKPFVQMYKQKVLDLFLR